VESTTTTTITSNYTMHFSNSATTALITVKSVDGSTLLAQTFNVEPSTGPRVLNPLPDPYQVASDLRPAAPGATWTSGRWYGGPAHVTGTNAAGIGVGTYIPVYVPNACSLSKFVVEATAATAVARLGLYASNGLGSGPGTLLLDAGTVDISSAAVVEATVDIAVERGLYWGFAVSQVASGTMRTIGATYSPAIGAFTAAGAFGANAINTYYQNSVTGALADANITGAALAGYKMAFKVA
jgi:hypothetical protein